MNARGWGQTGNKVRSALHPGTQLYHSLLCIVLQFLILPADGPNHHRCAHHLLRPDGKRVSQGSSAHSAQPGPGAGEDVGLGQVKKPWTGRCERPPQDAWGQCPGGPGSRPRRPPHLAGGGRWPSALGPAGSGSELLAGISAAICARGVPLESQGGRPTWNELQDEHLCCQFGEVPSGPVVGALSSHCRGFNFWVRELGSRRPCGEAKETKI